MSAKNRNTIFLEDATVIHQHSFAGDQFILRLQAPQCASTAKPGSFAHIQCDPDIPMRRPLSIMRANKEEGWIEFLYKIVGSGLRALSKASPNSTISTLGPIGNGFSPNPDKRYQLMLGGGVGIPPMTFLAEQLVNDPQHQWSPIVFMGSEVPFPFELQSSTIAIPGLDDIDASMPLMEALQVPCRLASLQDYPGCFSGYITELAELWLQSIDQEAQQATEIFACGPEPMLEATAQLAKKYSADCQLCLEEFMACGVGGCAGCTVEFHEDNGVKMKRVCVDGPVFEASGIYPK
jgi:dihydroorotate dehydrogenase electron transfer subunit